MRNRYRILYNPKLDRYKIQQRGWFLWWDLGRMIHYYAGSDFEPYLYKTLAEADSAIQTPPVPETPGVWRVV